MGVLSFPRKASDPLPTKTFVTENGSVRCPTAPEVATQLSPTFLPQMSGSTRSIFMFPLFFPFLVGAKEAFDFLFLNCLTFTL